MALLHDPVADRPPVEHRLLGLDRRTFKLPLLVVGVFVLWAWIAPAINGALNYDQPVRAGDAFFVAGGVTMAPPVGWDVEAGIRLRDRVRSPVADQVSTHFSGDGIAVTTQAGPFEGDARSLNARVADLNEQLTTSGAFSVKGRLETVTLDGRHGVVRRFTGIDVEGAIFTFAERGTGLDIIISGKPNALVHGSDEIARMLASVDFDSAAR